MQSKSSCFFLLFLTTCQVLTGERPFHGVKPTELAFNISSGVRPAKPENAEAIGISESLWELIQKCWDRRKTRRPQIQEVVEGVANAAANWDVFTPPSVMGPEEDTIEKESDELEHSELSSFSIVPLVHRPSVSRNIPALCERVHANH